MFSFMTIFAQNISKLNFNVMNKTELINAIAEKANLTKAQAKAALDATNFLIYKTQTKRDRV